MDFYSMIKDLEHKLNEQDARIESLEQELDETQEELRSLRTDHSLLEDTVMGVESDLESFAADVESLLQDENA
jgi:chromosome segregation ATPase